MDGLALGLIETRGLTGLIEAADAALKAAPVELISQEYVTGGYVLISLVGEVSAVTAAVDAGARGAASVGELVTTHVIPRPDSQLADLLGLDNGTDDPPAAVTEDDPAPPPEPVGGQADEPPSDEPATEPEQPPEPVAQPTSESSSETQQQLDVRDEPDVEDTQTELLETGDTADGSVATAETESWQITKDDPNEPSDSDDAIESDSAPESPVVDELDAMPVRQLRGMARATDGIAMSGREISTANKAELVEAIRRARGQL